MGIENIEWVIGGVSVLAGLAGYLWTRKASQKTLSSGLPSTSELKSEVKNKESNLDDALANTRSNFFGRLQSFFAKKEMDNWEEMEEVLYTSDLGPKTVQDLMSHLEDDLSSEEKKSPQKVEIFLKNKLKAMLLSASDSESSKLNGLDNDMTGTPVVWMIVGVNGSGKTTTLGKLASLLSQQNKKVMVAAGDTFRAAADAQLKVWAERANVEIFSPEGVSDPSAVAYQALERAKSQGFHHLLVDTAGRLHTQKNLMDELKKMKRVMQKIAPDAPHETIIILDANNGQNALQQAKEFHHALNLSGVIFTKMDGTSKAGVAFGIANELHLPIKRIGIGEKVEDLKVFSAEDFVASIFH